MNKTVILIRTIINRAIGLISQRPLPVYILCYHGFGQSNYAHNITMTAFAAQLDYLAHHAHFVTLDDIAKFIAGKKSLNNPSVAITFDDGYQSLMNIRPLIARYRVHPTAFVLSNPRGANRRVMDNTLPLLSIPEIKTLIGDGWDIGVHSATHSDLHRLTYQELMAEITGAKKTLEKNLGRKVKYFAYPKGAYTKQIVSVVKHAGFSHAFSMDDNPLRVGSDPFTLSRIGVNATHSLSEFPTLLTPWAQMIRKILK